MSLLCKGAGAFTFLIVAVFVALGRTTIFMPGSLSVTHQWLCDNCSACHRPWSLTTGGTAGCATENCHILLRLQRAHTISKQPSCPRCHVEHKMMTLTTNPIPDDTACVGCHAPKLKKDHPGGKPCYKCHFYHTPPRGMAPASTRPTAIPMNHSVHLKVMADILKVKDLQSLCSTCHVVREGAYFFAPFTRQGCYRNNENCHALQPLTGQKRFKDPLRQKPIAGFEKPHPIKVLFRHATHLKKHTCKECHPDMEKSKRITHAPIATPALCSRCHSAEVVARASNQ